MSSTNGAILDLGPGLIIVASVFGICFLLSIVLARVDGPASYAGLGLMPLAVVTALVLWFFPREDPSEVVEIKKFDPSFVSRNVIISVLGIALLGGLVAYGLFEVLEPIYARPLKKVAY